MGISCGISSSRYDCSCSSSPLPNPDPSRFVIEQVYVACGNIAVIIRYPDCTNYEGRKILVFKGMTEHELRSMKIIDPHFSKECPQKSPIARFVPTSEGWAMACSLAEVLGV